jgi:hypothetical protein
MEKIARRWFCGTAILAFPLLCARDKGTEDPFDQSDPILDTLADEITRIAADGAQNGFRAEHFRRCSGVVRILDARLEEKGTNRDLNRRLDDDDFYRLNPSIGAQMTVDFWNRHGIILNKSDLASRLTMDSTAYRQMKKNIKKLGGVRVLHASIADALERKAKEIATASFEGGAVIRNGRVTLPSSNIPRERYMTIQFDFDVNALIGSNPDCLCRAMTVEGALLSIACLAGCAPCCVPGAFFLALEKFLEGVGVCDPSRC